MDDLFNRCLYVVFKNEGHLSNHPLDPGGLTLKGITQAVYDSYRTKKGLPTQSVSLMTDEECEDIYYTLYWKPMNLSALKNEELILHVFDHGVNCGVRTSIKMLQRLVNTMDDGYIGQMTIKAVEAFKGDIKEEFKNRRKRFYIALTQKKPELTVFLKGWVNRVNKTHL